MDFKAIKLKIASPEDILAWSHGEVTKPETINYRTQRPEKDGLFSERIFGPTKDWECYCGKYRKVRYKGIVCDRCCVEVTRSSVRRERMGHITLAAPVAHIWFLKAAPPKLSLILDVQISRIEKVIYYAAYMITSVNEENKKAALEEIAREFKARKKTSEAEGVEKETLRLATQKAKQELESIELGKVLSETEFLNLSKRFGNVFEAGRGAESVRKVLEQIDLDKVTKEIQKELVHLDDKTRGQKLLRRLKLVEAMRKNAIHPEWMIMTVLPVLPPELRPMVALDGGRFATSDLNDLYRRVINRNNRLKKLLDLKAPDVIIRNEKRMLQEAVDALFDNGRHGRPVLGAGNRPLKSLSDMLKGKQGRFRQNLLGKRVDYSGRSVIVIGPELNLHQCGLPKEMALEIFKPFVINKMIARGVAPNVKSAKNMLDRKPSEVFDILEEITKDHPVLLNRAPTLHKLSIQAFYPVLIEGSAIRIHPAICSGFNADFDGDQMAVHIPLSKKAIDEAKELMLPGNNLLRPADGSPITTPASKEMALGIYYLTSIDERVEEGKTVYSDEKEAIYAYQAGKMGLRQTSSVRIRGTLTKTTVGRILFNGALPEYFDYVNEPVTSTVIKRLFAEAYSSTERDEVVKMIDAIKALGFYGGTISGISFGIFDAKILPGKQKMLEEADKKITEIETNFLQGLITSEEKKRLSQEVWIEVSEDLADKTWDTLENSNPIRIVIDAKVGRASRDQVKQLAAIRGLVVDPLGKIVELPIKSNFREGLSVFEYVTSSRGSRKG